MKTFPAALTLVASLLSADVAALAGQCAAYRASGPITVTRNNQVIQNLAITSTTGPAIAVNGFSGVTIANVVIRHRKGPGISIDGAANLTISNADIVLEGAPKAGKLASDSWNNIDCFRSRGLRVSNVRLTRGSSGIYLNLCPGSRLSFIEGHDQRGPLPRGQLVQWNNSNNGVLQDFSNETSLQTSWPEDNVNVYQSRNVVIRRGLIDGNNAPNGDAVLIDENSSTVLVEDVDALRQGNGCFGVYGGGGRDVIFRNTRCRDTRCNSVRGKPSSNSLAWAADPKSAAGTLRIINGSYYNLCNPSNLIWDAKMFAQKQITRRNFTPRKPLRVKLCRYGY